MAWRVAKSLLKLREQVNAMAPGRDKSSDGTIADANHPSTSDHQPNADGVVTAMDITHDPAHGVNAGELAEKLRASRDPRIKYVISNRRIVSSLVSPWQWRPYKGSNPHTAHVHVSVVADRSRYDDTDDWAIEPISHFPSDEPTSERCTDITATVFGGQSDPNRSAYDHHFITDNEFGVALPFFFRGTRPQVRVINPDTSKSVVCDIVDVGPWNTNDPYWKTNRRPQAESGTDLSGRHTNRAGIDLTPAAARKVGIDGKGKVDWEFVKEGGPGPVPGPSDPLFVILRQLIERLERLIAEVSRPRPRLFPDFEEGERPMPRGPADMNTLLQQLMSVLQGLDPESKTDTSPEARTERLRRAFQIISTIFIGADGKAPLGQVNGALGETIGKLLNGKKTGIGFVGSLLTALLANVPAGTGLANVLTNITPLAGFSGYALPIFLALSAWGVLGKMEKWAQGTAPPPRITK